MPVYDFSSGFNSINGSLSDLGKKLQDRRDGEILAQALGLNGSDTASQQLAPLGQLAQPQAPAYNPQGKEPTFAALSGTQPSERLTGDKEAFTRAIMPYALEASKQTGVDPRIIVAQAALESRWGKSAPGNNFFGIKSHGQDGGQTLATTEVVNGQPVKVNDSFRTYGGLGDSVMGYANFINANPRYQGLKSAQGLDNQIAALQASGYATDPLYGKKIASIARGLPMAEGQASAPADVPAQGAQPAQGFVIPGAGASTQGAIGTPDRAMIAQLVKNPGTRQAGLALWQEMRKGADVKTVDLGTSVGIMDNRGNILRQIPKTSEQPTAIREYEYARDNPGFFQQQMDLKRAGATNVNVDAKGENKFSEEANKLQAKRYSDIYSQADEARVLRGDVETLSTLLEGIGTGRNAEARLGLAQYAKAFGLDSVADSLTGGKMGEMEAAQSILDKMTPRMRVPGSGATSDMEMRTFRNSLPSLMKQPGGNKIVADTFRGLFEYQAQAGDIAGQALRREISQAQADKMLRDLPGPFEQFKAFQKDRSSSGNGETAQRQPIPQGYTAARVLDEAKKAVAAGKDKSAVAERLKAYGIDPSRLD